MEYGSIIAIDVVGGIKFKKEAWQSFEGFKVQTNKTQVLVLVSSGQSCCEDYGAICSQDDITEFIGANVIKVDIVDTALKKYDALEYAGDGDTIFVNIETDRGTFQLTVYNLHNGYYGHDAKVIIGENVITEEIL